MNTNDSFDNIVRRKGFAFVPRFIKFLHNRPRRKRNKRFNFNTCIFFCAAYVLLVTMIMEQYKITYSVSKALWLFIFPVICITVIFIVFSDLGLYYNEECEDALIDIFTEVYADIIVSTRDIDLSSNKHLQNCIDKIAGILYCELSCLGLFYKSEFLQFLSDLAGEEQSYCFDFRYTPLRNFIYGEIKNDIDVLSKRVPSYMNYSTSHELDTEEIKIGADYSKILRDEDLREKVISKMKFDKDDYNEVLTNKFEKDPDSLIAYDSKFVKMIEKRRIKSWKSLNGKKEKSAGWWEK